jgi:hypothetical protein
MTATSERFDVEAERRRLGGCGTTGERRQRYQEIGGDEALSRKPVDGTQSALSWG